MEKKIQASYVLRVLFVHLYDTTHEEFCLWNLKEIAAGIKV